MALWDGKGKPLGLMTTLGQASPTTTMSANMILFLSCLLFRRIAVFDDASRPLQEIKAEVFGGVCLSVYLKMEHGQHT